MMSEWTRALLDLGGLVASVIGLYGVALLLHPSIGHLATAESIGVLSLVTGGTLIDLLDRTARSFKGRGPQRRAYERLGGR